MAKAGRGVWVLLEDDTGDNDYMLEVIGIGATAQRLSVEPQIMTPTLVGMIL